MYIEILEDMAKFYRRINVQIEEFCQQTQLSCVFGCGECCTRFEPYISILEAMPIAQYLLEHTEKLREFEIAPRNKSQTLCPFFQVSQPLHCGIYLIRPLICRLFAFSGKQLPTTIHYEACKIIRSHCPEKFALARQLIQGGMSIPVYQEMHRQMRQIDFFLATDLHPVTRSVEIALAQREQIVTGKYTYAPIQHDETSSYSIPFSQFVRDHLKNESMHG